MTQSGAIFLNPTNIQMIFGFPLFLRCILPQILQKNSQPPILGRLFILKSIK